MKIRSYVDSNYKAMFFNGKTVRMKYDNSLPFIATPTPEIEDVAINDKCLANCSYCYTSALKTGSNFDDINQKALVVWGMKAPEDRPFQIAIGGAGEPTLHPEFISFLRTVKDFGIVPNYTTNGMHLNKKLLDATIEYSGGVAVSYHPHLKSLFSGSTHKFIYLKENGVKMNIHFILSDKESLAVLRDIFFYKREIFDYFVILPYQAVGRAQELEVESTWRLCFDWISRIGPHLQSKFAFGALFYEWMIKNEMPLKMSIYEPEIFSGYRLMNDSFDVLRKSSYDLSVK